MGDPFRTDCLQIPQQSDVAGNVLVALADQPALELRDPLLADRRLKLMQRRGVTTIERRLSYVRKWAPDRDQELPPPGEHLGEVIQGALRAMEVGASQDGRLQLHASSAGSLLPAPRVTTLALVHVKAP